MKEDITEEDTINFFLSMINTLITKAFRNPFITLILFLGITGISIAALFKTPVDALPDLSENQVILITEWAGQNPKNIEDQITYPLTVAMQGLAGVRDIRAMSQFGVSMVTIIFEDDIDVYFARDRVSERLSLIKNTFPEGVSPLLGPDATGLGQVFMYTLESDDRSLTELRSLQDFTIRYALQSVSGVAEVASIGGYVKQYQVIVDPIKLEQFGLPLMPLISAIQAGNDNVSGNVVDTGDREIAIQGIGFFENTSDIGNIVVGKKQDETPLLVSDVGVVRMSGAPRRGILADDTAEKVGGIVVMRYGENPLDVISAIKGKIQELENTLPEGVRIQSFYDRSGLIWGAIQTLVDVLWQELLITTIILALFLWHFGATLITALALLFGVLFTFLCMKFLGIPSNIMSLGGIAIAIGTMVDSAIVMSENAYSALLRYQKKEEADLKSSLSSVEERKKRDIPFKKRAEIILRSSKEVGSSIFFAIFIIVLSFLPIFLLEGMEGKLFTPLAFTNVFAMLGALIAALFLVPLLSVFFLRGKLKDDAHIPLVKKLQQWYKPLLLKALRFRKITLGIMGGLLITGGITATTIGSEFMPPLNEGSIMYMPMTVPDVSEQRALELLLMTNQILSKFPEVESVVGKSGRAQTATDPAPLAMLETYIELKPKKEWREGMTKGKLIGEMNRAIKIPDFWNGFTQPIIGRIDMLSTGIRAQVGIKVFGDDPAKLEDIALEAEEMMNTVPGASGVATIRTIGLRYLDINLRDDLLAQHGIEKGDVLSSIAAGVGGKMITKTIEGREQYGVELRLQQSYRQDIEDIRSLPLVSKNGKTLLLQSIADIALVDGPAVINSENGVMRSAVQMNVRGRDLVSFVEEGRNYLDQNLQLPEGYFVEWTGQYENQVRAKKSLSLIVPLVFLLIFLLLFLNYRDFGLVAIVLISIPFGLLGGIFALFFAGFNFSVAVWVGFIALFGNAVETGMVIVVYLENAFRERFRIPLVEGGYKEEHLIPQVITRQGIHEAVVSGAMKRLRPVLMTAFTSVIGLLPMIISTGIGAEVQKPLAIVVIGGLTTSIILTLIALPILFSYLREREVGRIIQK